MLRREKRRLLRPACPPGTLLRRDRNPTSHDPLQDSAPYSLLSGVWDAYATKSAPDYVSYLLGLVRLTGHDFDNVLELACGTGIQTSRFADAFSQVTALDSSEPMLRKARANLAGAGNVELVKESFSSFSLKKRFDLVICTGDSLNHVSSMEELAEVFRRVDEHLVDGGLFVFDVLSSPVCASTVGERIEIGGGEGTQPLVMEFSSFDPKSKIDTSIVSSSSSKAMHIRRAIDYGDVVQAAQGRFDVLDCFNGVHLGLFTLGTTSSFYALRKKGGARPLALFEPARAAEPSFTFPVGRQPSWGLLIALTVLGAVVGAILAN